MQRTGPTSCKLTTTSEQVSDDGNRTRFRILSTSERVSREATRTVYLPSSCFCAYKMQFNAGKNAVSTT